MMKDIAIYGAGGYGNEIAAMIKKINEKELIWNFIGFFDDAKIKGDDTYYGPILGNLDDLNSWNRELSVVLAIGNPLVLKELSNKICNAFIDFPNIIAPDLVYHDEQTVVMGKGNVIMYHSIVSCFTSIGDFNLINSNVSIGHDCVLGSFNVLNPAVRISGTVQIGDANFFGVGSILMQNLTVGDNTQISAGCTIFRNTLNDHLYVPNPTSIKIIPINKLK